MNIFPEHGRFLSRHDKEALLNQSGTVIWLYGLSGSGKSTIANAVERILHQEGRMTVILDGDNFRMGLNAGLDFSDQDRAENIRRIAEVAKMFMQNGVITFVSAITPKKELRDIARAILGKDLFEVFIDTSYQACKQRDVKGLYAKAERGEIAHFTGKDSGFEIPTSADLILKTEGVSVEDSSLKLLETIRHKIERMRDAVQ